METHIFHYFPVFFAGLKNHRDQIHPFFQGTPWPRAEGRWQRMPRPFLSASGWDHRSLPASGLWHSQLEKKHSMVPKHQPGKMCVCPVYNVKYIRVYQSIFLYISSIYIYIYTVHISIKCELSPNTITIRRNISNMEEECEVSLIMGDIHILG